MCRGSLAISESEESNSESTIHAVSISCLCFMAVFDGLLTGNQQLCVVFDNTGSVRGQAVYALTQIPVCLPETVQLTAVVLCPLVPCVHSRM